MNIVLFNNNLLKELSKYSTKCSHGTFSDVLLTDVTTAASRAGSYTHKFTYPELPLHLRKQ